MRTGIMCAQILPSDVQKSMIIITDGICGIYNFQALQSVLTQLRHLQISCSFIQVRYVITKLLSSFFLGFVYGSEFRKTETILH